ncbi:MAG: hypothetical protein A2V98_14815 [Planctomycetes bacterium RBG_16_64_12]|nr:MAG: hypothetical protein A2V98_14815 [Planctomycetes bacterium RBG_16_64_12]
MKNHTSMHLPEPTRRMRIDVRQDPGMSYPTPPNRAWIVEQAGPAGAGSFHAAGERHETIVPAADPYYTY